MSFDLNILCVMQELPNLQIKIDTDMQVEILNKHRDDFPKGNNLDRGSTPWLLMNSIPGYWYYLYSCNPDDNYGAILGSYYLCDFFDDTEMEPKQPITLKTTLGDYPRQLGAFTIRPFYKKDFINILQYMIKESPLKRVIFLARYQDLDIEHIIGTFSYTNFLLMLNTGGVSFNVCYVISGE